MSAFDKIIGYKTIKQQLVRTCDVVRNFQKYDALGVHTPRGMLLEGKPGVGKTLMANCFIAECGRPVFVCRKDKADNEFVEHIKSVFEDAKQNVPSIVLLDDIDKFSNDDYDSCDSQEFVTVQSCIDEIGDLQVFVIATANDTGFLPDSLKRAGRFDIRIAVGSPEYTDAKEIVAYFLKQKQCIDSVAVNDSAELLAGKSCAEIETIINNAGIFAGHEGKNKIEYCDVIKAFLSFAIGDDAFCESSVDGTIDAYVAYHEAGHAAVAELLYPGSITLVSVGGVTRFRGLTLTSPFTIPFSPTIEYKENQALIALGGRAATEVAFGAIDVGASDDIKKAIRISSNIVDDTCIHGFATYDWFREVQPVIETRNELLVVERVEEWYLRVKKMLVQNRNLLDDIAKKLLEKGTITKYDITRIKSFGECFAQSRADEGFDKVYWQALRLCMDKKQCSVPFLQRNLKIGFHLAAQIVERMITDGYIRDSYNQNTKSYEILNR